MVEKHSGLRADIITLIDCTGKSVPICDNKRIRLTILTFSVRVRYTLVCRDLEPRPDEGGEARAKQKHLHIPPVIPLLLSLPSPTLGLSQSTVVEEYTLNHHHHGTKGYRRGRWL